MWVLILAVLVIGLYHMKRTRFYFAMFFASWLYENPKIAKNMGIDMGDVFTYKGTRKTTRIYSDGVFVKILQMITGMELRISKDTHAKLIKMQNEHSRELSMEQYFDQLNDCEMTLLEFEHFLSKVLLIETNNIYNVFSEEQLNELIKNSSVIFEVLNGLSGGMIEGFKLIIMNMVSLYKISKILKTAPEPERLLIFGPQLSLVTNFSKMIMTCRQENKTYGDLQPNDFLNLKTKFFAFEEMTEQKHRLIFLDRKHDLSDGIANKAFGPQYIQCPGAKMTIDYINSILPFLQKFNIEIIGEPIYKGIRFKNISNRPDIKIKFMLKDA